MAPAMAPMDPAAACDAVTEDNVDAPANSVVASVVEAVGACLPAMAAPHALRPVSFDTTTRELSLQAGTCSGTSVPCAASCPACGVAWLAGRLQAGPSGPCPPTWPAPPPHHAPAGTRNFTCMDGQVKDSFAVANITGDWEGEWARANVGAAPGCARLRPAGHGVQAGAGRRRAVLSAAGRAEQGGCDSLRRSESSADRPSTPRSLRWPAPRVHRAPAWLILPKTQARCTTTPPAWALSL